MKRCLAGLCLLLMLLTACTARPSRTPVTDKDDAARRAWLEQQGWQTEEQPVRTLTVQLSLAGQEDYLALQQEAGLPLADYDGQTVTRCTYTVTNYPGRTGDVQVNLYLCGDVIVGRINPDQCPMFGRKCSPMDPFGPCMVSSEGSCGIWYRNVH